MPCMETKKAPFRVIVLYSAGHLGSATILNRLVDMPEFQIVGVIKAQTIELSWKGLKRLRKHLKKVGWRFGWLLAWQHIVQSLTYGLIGALREKRLRLRPTWRLAKQKGIPVLACKNINDPEAITFIRTLSPDLIISAYFSQILKQPVIELPRIGTLNIHPGWLPAYKGAMAYFWVLKNGSENAGVTLHWIDEGIDTGEIIARENFQITPGMTQQNVLMVTAELGAELIQQAGRKLQDDQPLSPIAPTEKEQDNYYPMPGSDAFESYFKRRRFFRIRDIIKTILRRTGRS